MRSGSIAVRARSRASRSSGSGSVSPSDTCSRSISTSPSRIPGITRLFDWISPDYLVFEFFYSDMAEWQTKIARQKRALDGVDPSRCPLCGRPNECAALRGESDCWCKTVVVPQDVMDRVPPEARGVACVCRECAGLTGEPPS